MRLVVTVTIARFLARAIPGRVLAGPVRWRRDVRIERRRDRQDGHAMAPPLGPQFEESATVKQT
jgi:hypothetical protein